MFDEKQKSSVKRIHLVTDDGLYDQKAFYTVKVVFYSSCMNVGEFVSYLRLVSTKHNLGTTNKLLLTLNISVAASFILV